MSLNVTNLPTGSAKIMALLFCWLVIPLAGAFADAPEAETPVATSLLAAAQVNGDGIYLEQLISAAPKDLHSRIRIADAPLAGKDVVLNRAQVIDAWTAAASGAVPTNWSGALQIKVSRRMRPLAESELRDLLTAAVQREYIRERGQLELHLQHGWVPFNIPDEPMTLKVIDFPASGLASSMIVRFELGTSSEIFGSWQQVVQARVWKDILTARSPLRRGQTLGSSDLTRERRDSLTLRDTLDVLPTDGTLLELVENVSAGNPVFLRSVRPKPLVNRGQITNALVIDGALSITLKVEVLEDGIAGQFIRVRNPQSNRELRGKVQNEQTIVVIL